MKKMLTTLGMASLLFSFSNASFAAIPKAKTNHVYLRADGTQRYIQGPSYIHCEKLSSGTKNWVHVPHENDGITIILQEGSDTYFDHDVTVRCGHYVFPQTPYHYKKRDLIRDLMHDMKKSIKNFFKPE